MFGPIMTQELETLLIAQRSSPSLIVPVMDGYVGVGNTSHCTTPFITASRYGLSFEPALRQTLFLELTSLISTPVPKELL